ncbi:hypothetical protein AMES_7002 [Amycolatopsis mediterranei S699]|uniref:Uncharacterized protein n=2 Tax=Amycolatopsis mediterranei TaxID=33910 RepID=A0A0H3DF40_AMYMU|nr:hypothetical protein [Amycolatopsis mediterranei]ADJ48827.1 hypothetical protein AMED_7109 [Amycolatopsis mediterranei U32]AEK45771.1 hypothetical protein RAM_36490 [Amycolatopsis mediterranei S699]AFO80537.1 hypothetical protein AMES_7002 [Amycolatopsis mediterranei S699]AGT87665.1 hypothetical protein B737_7002 [Amycolatopsis mediterranei RB]KDU94061.1 hypothetical protein DV36_01600 [Amycolatopsis mediterranei]
MNSPDEWGQLPLAWERASGAIAVSRERGWEWTGRPPGSAEPEELIGRRAAGTHDDVVVIEAAKNPMQAIGARFAPGDWGKHGSFPIRGPITGAPDEVLFEVLDWADEDAR